MWTSIVTALCPAVILIFATNPTLGLKTKRDTIPLVNDDGNISNNDTFLPDGDEGSGEVVEPAVVYNATESEMPHSLAHLVVNDSSGQPCLLATLNATMQVSYRVPEGIVHETYIAFADIWLPEDVHAEGQCGENTSMLLLDWGNNTFHVNITFSKKASVSKTENATWSLTSMAITYDLSNAEIFPGSSEKDTVTVERHHLSLFKTPVGFTHVCNNEVKLLVGSTERGVAVTFHNVRVAAFGVTSSDFPSDVVECEDLEDDDDHEEILVPLIVACCLSVIVIIVVVAYVISRKVQEARDQSEYRPMP